ncbi:hypothetical protein E4U41_004421 [Claviceps citrina]|nr:hypothetical protein E4U41_004421 [Claviceps citrina]
MQLSAKLGVLGLWAVGSIAAAVQGKTLDYAGSIHALSFGNVDTKGTSSGEVWFNVTGFKPDKLPHIQQDVGIYTMDNLDSLKTIAGWGSRRPSKANGATSMNGHADYAKASSAQMREGLLAAVTKPDRSGVDSDLIDVYVKTSSSPLLAEAYNALRTSPVPSVEPRWYREACDSAHQAAKSACRTLIENIHFNATVKSGGPRSICYSGCCISWSANATFELQNLYNAANYCVNACGTATVSCEVYGVSLQGTIVDQCLSNRATGCT